MSESTLNFCRGCDANVTAGGQIAEVLPDGGAKGEPRTSMDDKNKQAEKAPRAVARKLPNTGGSGSPKPSGFCWNRSRKHWATDSGTSHMSGRAPTMSCA